MNEPHRIDIALKEWQTVTDALASGRQMILLRKGGVSEVGDEFKIEHDRFVLFPTFLHQHKNLLKQEQRNSLVAHATEPSRVRIETFAEVTDILELKDRAIADRLDTEHIWLPALINMRFNYKPERPLYLLLVRTYRLANAVEVENTPAYAGCKSWVQLDESIDLAGMNPAMNNKSFDERRATIQNLLK